jgi:serine/threonine protein kinase
MAAPSTTDELLDLMRRSGVIEEKRISTYLSKRQGEGSLPDDPRQVANLMVRDGILTHFQADQFLQGRWRRFSLGKYKVLERIGIGGMGSVYLCEHMLMKRRAAVKVLPAAKANDEAARERFYREARAVAALDHPNIVRAYDIDVVDDLHFLVMEYVDGSSLLDIVRKVGPINYLRVAHYVSQSALGLQHAYETASLVHRDVKPGNIIVDRTGVVKVLDLGLARFFKDEEDILTKKFDENVLGTADYLAPEQVVDSHTVDIRADVYSLGATAYFCLTGLPPFGEGSVAQKLIWHQTRKPKSILSIRSDVPEAMVTIIEKMMSKDPAERYQTPADIVEAFKPWTTVPIPPPPSIEMPQLSLAAQGPNYAGTSPDTPLPSRRNGEAETLPPRLGTMTPIAGAPQKPEKQPLTNRTPKPPAGKPPAPRPAPVPAAKPRKDLAALREPTPTVPVKQVPKPLQDTFGPSARTDPANPAPPRQGMPVATKPATPAPPRPTSAVELDVTPAPERATQHHPEPATNWLFTGVLFVVVAVVTFAGWWAVSGHQLPFVK